MAIKALDLNSMVKYVSKLDTGEPKTEWSLGILDTRIRKQLEDVAWEYETDPSQPGQAKAKASFNLGRSEMDFVAFGLKGFDGFIKADGKQVYFKAEDRNVNGKIYHVVADEVLKIIPGDIVRELAEQIKNINNVDEEERKN